MFFILTRIGELINFGLTVIRRGGGESRIGM